MDRNERDRIEVEISDIMTRYMEVYGASSLHVEIDAVARPLRVKIRVTEIRTV